MNSARFVSGHWVVAVLLGCQYQNKLCSSVVWQRRHTTDPNPWQIKPEVSPILSQRWTWKKKHLRSCYMSSLKSHIQMAAYSWSYKDSRGTRKMKMSKKRSWQPVHAETFIMLYSIWSPVVLQQVKHKTTREWKLQHHLKLLERQRNLEPDSKSWSWLRNRIISLVSASHTPTPTQTHASTHAHTHIHQGRQILGGQRQSR